MNLSYQVNYLLASVCYSFMRWPTKAVAVHFHLLYRSHLKIGYLDISVTSDFCNCQPLEIRLLHLANYCFTGTVIGKPLLKCLKAGSGDDVDGDDVLFSPVGCTLYQISSSARLLNFIETQNGPLVLRLGGLQLMY